jgi:signal transduction histidine kinase/DNA-binding response OmpR family regulator/ligand-binding sensor domain-containing protein
MVDDSEGNMWFGLNKGVMKYDGYHWELFDDQPCLKSPIGTLLNSSMGNLYAGSESGLLTYSSNGWRKIFPSDDSLKIAVTSITESNNGDLWVGIQNGLLRLQDGKHTIYTVLSRTRSFKEAHPQATIVVLPDEILLQRNFGRVDEIFINNEEVWLFMSRNNDGKLLRFNPSDTLNGLLTKHKITQELAGVKLANRNQMIETQKGEKWIINGFYKRGVFKHDGKAWKQIKLSDNFGGDELHTDIMEVSDGSLWIGGLGKFFVYKNKVWNIYTAPNLPIPSSRIIFHEAADGNIWIAGIQGDVFRVVYQQDKWLRINGLNFQTQDSEGQNWFISANSQIVFNHDDEWYSYSASDGVIDSPVRLVATKNGRIWIAGSHNGIAATAYLKEGKWIKQLHPKVSWGIDPRSVFQDKDGSLWFGASVDRQDNLGQISGILQLFNPDSDSLEWKHHTQADGIVQHNVYGIGQSSDGKIWAGGTNLLMHKPPRWQVVTGIEHFNEFVDIVYSRHNLWVGSRYYGLFRYDGEKWVQFTKNSGLPSNTIISIYEEEPNKVWVITDKDIAWYDGKNWVSGLFNEEFKIPREGGEITGTSDGTIWINKSLREWKRRAFPFSVASPESFEDFWTVRYQCDTMPPITKINVFTERVDQSGNTLIGWTGVDHWEVTPTKRLTYSYKLNDEEWSDFTTETSVVLTNLKSGKHTFRVRARDLDHNIEKVPAQIDFSVKPPIWKQPWFIALVLSFLITIGYYEAKLINRNRSLFKLNESLKEAFEKLESRKQKIELQKEQIQEQKEELEKKNLVLEEKNEEIVQQRDRLQEMIEKVEELSNVKQRFFTNISHEFRTPLTLILGSIEQLINSPARTEKAKLTQAYEIIQRNSRRILRLINQILEVRKIELGKLQLRMHRGDIVSFTKDIVSLFNDLASKYSINLLFNSKDNNLEVMFDPDIIEKIVSNLVSNAFKFTPPNGRIEVSVEQRVEPNTNSDAIYIKVVDTGKGIPKQFVEHIFDRFYQLKENYSQQNQDSSGIGLSYVKDLVTTHNGNIYVESEMGIGSTFTFFIPVTLPTDSNQVEQEQPVLSPSEKITDSIRHEIESINITLAQQKPIDEEIRASKEDDYTQGDKLSALIVEDEFEFRKFLRDILNEDFEVIEAVNGADGYNQALKFQPDIIISDVMMPQMNGIELCGMLKKNLITNHIPVIMLTARTAPEHKLEGYQVGADAYIEKPFNREYLKIRINNLLLAKDKTREKILRELTTQPEEIKVHSEDDKMLSRIREVLEENISNSDFDVETMSQLFCLSRFHFSRKIKQLTGLNPKEIIDSFRLKRAGQILLQQKISISEVAYMVGFDHPNSFTRAFKKHHSMSPTEYISQNLS